MAGCTKLAPKLEYADNGQVSSGVRTLQKTHKFRQGGLLF